MGILFSKKEKIDENIYKYYDKEDQELLKDYHDYLLNKLPYNDREIFNEFVEHINFSFLYQKIYFKSILINDLLFLKDLEVNDLELEKIKKENEKMKINIELKNLEINKINKNINSKEYLNLNYKKRKYISKLDKDIKSFPRKIRKIKRDFNINILDGSKRLQKLAKDLN